ERVAALAVLRVDRGGDGVEEGAQHRLDHVRRAALRRWRRGQRDQPVGAAVQHHAANIGGGEKIGAQTAGSVRLGGGAAAEFGACGGAAAGFVEQRLGGGRCGEHDRNRRGRAVGARFGSFYGGGGLA